MSATVPSTTLQKAVAGWNNFFFTPRDPSTLGLMRILAGIFILYTHLAYTPDLLRFFGKNGWADLPMVDSMRKEFPFFAPDWAWNDSKFNLSVPMDRQVRETFLLKWAQNLPADINRRRDALQYVSNLPMNPQDIGEGLAFAEQLMIRPRGEGHRAGFADYRFTTDEERQRSLTALTRETVLPDERGLLPRYMHEFPQNEREAIRKSVLAFIATIPSTVPGEPALIFAHLNHQAFLPLPVRKPSDPQTELQRTLLFLTGQADPAQPADDRGTFLPDDLRERREVLEYLNRWSVDPRRTYVQGFYIWSVWFHVTDPFWMSVIHVGFLIVMAMFAAGLWTRVTSVITWIAVLSYIHRNNQILFGMDTMMNIALIYLMIGPSGAALSVDRWLEKRRARRELEAARAAKRDTSEWEMILAGPRPSVLAGFITRMIQIHFCFIYAASGVAKLKGPAWWNHTAIWYTVANPEFSPTVFQPYMWTLMQVADFRWICEIGMTIGSVFTLFLEIGFPFLVWRPLLRPYVVIAAILLHTGIAVFMGLTVFGLFMMVLLMAFIPPETVRRWLELGETKPSDAPKPVTAAAPAVHAAAKA